MKMKMLRIGLNNEEKDCIKKISKRLADSQRDFLKAQDESFLELMKVCGYVNPAGAQGLFEAQMMDLDAGGKVVIFDDAAAWAAALTEVTEADLLEAAENEIVDRRAEMEKE